MVSFVERKGHGWHAVRADFLGEILDVGILCV
jgi:hypothetical protein